MLIRTLLLSMVLAVIFIPSSDAQAVHDFTLQECLTYALENSLEMQKALLENAVGEQQMREQKSKFLPRVEAYAQYLHYFALPVYVFPEEEGQILSGGTAEGPYPVKLGQSDNLYAGVKARQTLFDYSMLTGSQSQENFQSLQNLRLEQSEEELIYNVALNFYQIITRQQQMQILEANAQRLDRLQKILQLQYENDMVKQTDVRRIELNMANLATRQQRLVSGIAQQKNLLKFLMGMPMEDELNLVYTLSEEIAPPMPSSPDFDTFTQSRLLEERKQLQQVERKSTKGRYFPSLEAFAHVQYQAQRDAFNFFDGNETWFPVHLLGVSLKIPIFNGFETTAQMEQLALELSQIELEGQQSEAQLSLAFENARNELESSYRHVQEQEESQELAKEVYNQVELQYKEGVTLLSELLNTEAERREAENAYQQALLDYQIAQLEILKATDNLKNLLNE